MCRCTKVYYLGLIHFVVHYSWRLASSSVIIMLPDDNLYLWFAWHDISMGVETTAKQDSIWSKNGTGHAQVCHWTWLVFGSVETCPLTRDWDRESVDHSLTRWQSLCVSVTATGVMLSCQLTYELPWHDIYQPLMINFIMLVFSIGSTNEIINWKIKLTMSVTVSLIQCHWIIINNCCTL